MKFFQDLKKYYHYIIFATKSQLRSEVSNSYLDWIWWLLEPFCNMLVYTFIFGYVFNAKEQFFPVFIFIGISMWSFFSRTLNASVKLIKTNKAIVTKVYIPKQVLLIKLMCVNAFKMFLSFLIVFLMMIFYGVKVNLCVFYIIPCPIVLFIFSYGIGCFLMHFGVYVEDLAYITSIVLSMMMYLTGIFYSVSKRVPEPFGTLLSTYNPVAFLISGVRNALLYQQKTALLPLTVWFAVSVIVAALGTKLIYKNENNYVKVI